jgi:hypothetical protein
MTRRRVFTCCLAVVLGVMVLAASAFAARSPGFLRASDLPAGYEQVGDPTTSTIVNQFAIDAAACTQTFEADATATEITSVQFADATTGATALGEAVVAFPDAKRAKAALKHRAATARAGAKCGSVGNVASEGIPASSVVYEKVKVPKIGQGSYGIGRGSGEPEGTAIGVEFVSGRYVVVLNTFGNGEGPSVKELTSIARKAEQRVSE